ncbi:hypothetical protein FWC63_00950 [Candidatus Saccharibacteria bacterium]|nr:hypothetical protein [Candidatus Saccharibacteria bacterium]
MFTALKSMLRQHQKNRAARRISALHQKAAELLKMADIIEQAILENKRLLKAGLYRSSPHRGYVADQMLNLNDKIACRQKARRLLKEAGLLASKIS